jgi:F-type H+-transporting ATPase subunit delta
MKDDYAYLLSLAFFRRIKTGKEYESLLGELDNVISLIENDKKLYHFFNHMSIPLNKKLNIINEITGDANAVKLLTTLLKTKRINELKEIKRQLSVFQNFNSDFVDVLIKLPFETGDIQKTKIKKTIENYTGKKININITIDPSILGGLYIKIGDTVIDYTAKKELLLLKETLLKS